MTETSEGTMELEDMTDTPSAAARELRRRWIENWRVVNEAQDSLVRSESMPDPATSLEAGLSLIAFARTLSRDNARPPHGREADDEAVRRTWQRLRAAHVR